MEALELAIPVDVAPPSKVMGSEVVVVGARVCDNDGEARQSDAVSGFTGSNIDKCSSIFNERGTFTASGSVSWAKKQDRELYRSNYQVSRSVTEDTSQGLDHGITNGSIALISGSEGKQIQRRAGKVPRIGSESFRKPRVLKPDILSPQSENDDAKFEQDMPGSHLVKCSNADKSQAAKQRNNINGRRGDRRSSKVAVKAKFDPFSLKAGLTSFSPAAGGSNAFGMYGLKPDVHDVTRLVDDISLDELLDGTIKCPTFAKDKGKRTVNANENVLESVRKVCSLIRLQGMQQVKQPEELDIHAVKKNLFSSSPSANSAESCSDGDGSTVAGSSKCNKVLESCVQAEASVEMSDSPLYQPRDILERLSLPPPKDLESLLQDAVKPGASMKLTDSRSSKQLSHRASLPPFPWSHNFNGHYKSNNDALKTSNKSTCCGRWVRVSSSASFIGGSTEGFVDLDSLTYDHSLVPAGQLKYRLPEVGKTSTTFISQNFCQQDVSAVGCSASPLPTPDLRSPKVLAAARTLCDMASYCSKHNFGGILKWPKQPSQKAMKARKSRLVEIPEEDLSPVSETVHGDVVRSPEYGSSFKKPKTSLVERREDHSHVQAVIGLSSVSAPRSNRSSPSRLSRDSISETRHLSGNFVKSSFMVPPPPRVLDRNNQNPQKLRKITPMDWNRTRS